MKRLLLNLLTTLLIITFLAALVAWPLSYYYLFSLCYGTNIDLAETTLYRGQLRLLYVYDDYAFKSGQKRKWRLTPPPPAPIEPKFRTPPASTSPSNDNLIPYADLLGTSFYDWSEGFFIYRASAEKDEFKSSTADTEWDLPWFFDVRAHVTPYPGGFRTASGNALTNPPHFKTNYSRLDIPLPYPIALLALLFLPFIRRHFKKRQLLAKNLCPTCSYDLRASRSRCPECGTPIPANPLQSPS